METHIENNVIFNESVTFVFDPKKGYATYSEDNGAFIRYNIHGAVTCFVLITIEQTF